MSDRGFLAIALAAAGFSTRGWAQSTPPPFHEWVRQLYGSEIARQAALARGDRSSALSDAAYLDLFTPDVRTLILNSRDRVMPASEPDGPILHSLLGWGALPGRDVQLIAVSPSGSSSGAMQSAAVDITIAGRAIRITLNGAFDPSATTWRIADVHYGAGARDATYVNRLKRMATWPRR